MEKKRVGIVLFENIEILDFCGPFEVFSVTPDFYDNVKAIPGALTGVTQLHEGGFKVVFLTSGIFPSKAQGLYRSGFIDDRRPEMSRKIVVAADKSLLARPNAILIDDYHGNAKGWDKFNLFEQPWNEEHRKKFPMRARSWPEVIGWVSEILRYERMIS